MRTFIKIIFLLGAFCSEILTSFSQSKIVYSSDSLGTWDIYEINPDGTGRKILLSEAYAENLPKWSPDGSQIAFTSDKDGDVDLYIMDASGVPEGSGVYPGKLIETVGNIESFGWSSDGTKIAYSENNAGDWEIYLFDFGTSQITPLTSNDTTKMGISWSNDGNFILYEQAMTPEGPIGHWQLFAIDPAGNNVTRLTYDSEDERDPVLSPNSDKIAFISTRNGNLYCDKLWIADFVVTNGKPAISGDRMLVTTGRHQRPAWSPDGSKIVFGNNNSSCTWDVDLYTVNPDGTNLTRLTANPVCSAPDWTNVSPTPPQTGLIMDEQFNDFTGWVPAADNGSECSWTVVNGAAKIATMGYSSSGWIGAIYEKQLPQTIPPGTDFILKAHIRVMDGDPSGSCSGVGVQLMDNDNNRVVRINFNDSQAASGYGGLQYSTGLGMVYTNDPNGFSTNNPTLDGVLEIHRTGITWTAYLDGQQLGSPQDFDVPWTATKVQITNARYMSYGYRDGEIDYITIEAPNMSSGLNCFYTGSGGDSIIIQSLNELGFTITFSDTWPNDLSTYDLVVCSNYSMCTPTYAPLVGDYVTNGGSALICGGTPSSFGGGGYSCSNIASWFGTANYANVGDCIAKVNYDNPIGSNLFAGDTIAILTGWGAAAVTNVYNDCNVLSSYSTGPVHSFIRESGTGRVAFSGGIHDNRVESYILHKSILTWLARLDTTYYLSVSPTASSVSATSGTATITVSSNVTWNVSDDVSWLTASKTDNTTITVNYQENITTNPRTATITVTGNGVAPRTATVTQQAAIPFIDISPDSATVNAAAGNISFSVSSNILWNVTGNAGWTAVTKNDTTSFNINYQENTTVNTRTALFTITGTGVPDKKVKLKQLGAAPFLSVSPASVNVSAQTDTAVFLINANVSWNPSSDATWVTLQKTDTSTLTVLCQENTSTNIRTANITITGDSVASHAVTLVQEGAAPYLNVTPADLNVSATAGDAILVVSSNILWGTTSSATWLNAIKVNNDTILLQYNENNAIQERNGIITVSGSDGNTTIVKTVSVSQAGADPYIHTSDTSFTVNSDAGNFSVAVYSNVNWSASENETWLSVVKTDAGTVTVNYDQNNSTSSRQGNFTLSGPELTPLVLSLSQNGVEPALVVSPASVIVGEVEGDTVIDVNSTVAWNVSVNKSWLTVTKIDTSTIKVNYSENLFENSRTAAIEVAGNSVQTQYVTFTQKGTPPYLSVSPSDITIDAYQGDTIVTVLSNVDWQVSTSADWVILLKTDSAHLKVSYNQNNLTIGRNATILVSGTNVSSQFININQQAALPYLNVDSTSLNLHSANGNMLVNVQSNVDWYVSDNSNWLIVTKVNNNTINIQYLENTSTASRSAVISLAGPNVSSQNIQVTQDRAIPFLNTGNSYISISQTEGDTSITVHSNVDWTWLSSAEWFTVSKIEPDQLYIRFDENPDIILREGFITLSGPGVDTIFITVAQQKADPKIHVNTNLIYFPAQETDTLISVESNISWDISSNVSWLSLKKVDSANIGISCTRNRLTAERSGQISIGGQGIEPVIIDIYQSGGLPFLMTNYHVDTVSAKAGAVLFNISSNVVWEWNGGEYWTQAEKIDSTTFKIRYEPNATGEYRTAYFYLTATGVNNLILSVVQEPMKNDLSIQWIFPAANPECGISANENIMVMIHNHGKLNASGFKVGYTVQFKDNKQTARETVYSTIEPDSNLIYTFKQSVSMGKKGEYVCAAFVDLSGDENTLNDTASIHIQNDPIIIETTANETSCNGSTGVIVINNISGGIPPYKLYWSTGDTTKWSPGELHPKIENLPYGQYQVIVQDAVGCSNYQIVQISDAGGPLITDTLITDATCYGSTDGAVNIEVAGGTKPYSYLWTTGDTTEDVANLSAGHYEVSISDLNGCKLNTGFEVEQADPIQVTALVTDANCGVQNGRITLEVSGGNAPYTFLWDTGDTIPNPSFLSGGFYTVTVTDINHCSTSEDVLIKETGAPEINVTMIKPSACGNNDGAIELNINGESSPALYNKFHFDWSTGDSTYYLVNVKSGTYSVEVRERVQQITGNQDTLGICRAFGKFYIPSLTPASVPICMVTVDSATNRNMIIFSESANTTQNVSYNIYREENQANVFIPIAHVKSNGDNMFIDTLANPEVRSWRYKINITDSCGITSDFSQVHKTIHLMSSLGLNNNVNLSWSGYVGFVFSSYYLYRYSDKYGFQQIAELPGSQGSGGTYTDIDPPDGYIEYFVAVRSPDECNTYTKTSHNSSRSNRKSYWMDNSDAAHSITEKLRYVGIYPNPSKGIFNLTFEIVRPNDSMKVRVIDLQGRVIYERNIQTLPGANTEEINLTGVSPGLYHLQVVLKSEILNKPIVIE